MNQIARCDWLPERVRWRHLARSGLPAVSRKQNFTKSHIINPLLNKFVRSRWLDIGLVLFLRVYVCTDKHLHGSTFRLLETGGTGRIFERQSVQVWDLKKEGPTINNWFML